MKNRHPVEGQFRSEFPAICNPCGVMVALATFLRFFGKNNHLRSSYQTSVLKVFTSSWSTLLYSNVVKFFDGKIDEIVRYLPNKKKQNFHCRSNCPYCADRAQNLPDPAPNNVITVTQISSKSVHFRRSYSRTREHRFCPVEWFAWSFGRIMT